MSGIQQALLSSSGGEILLSVNWTYTSGKTTVYSSGFVSSLSNIYSTAGANGSLSSPNANGAQIVALYAYSTTGSGASYQAVIEVTGNRTSGFITRVNYNGVSFGTIGTYTYNSTPNTTTILLGASGVANPIPASGNPYLIAVT